MSLDEGTIPPKSRLSIKLYNKDKPPKFGVKSFILCEGETGRIVGAEIYTGKRAQNRDGIEVVGNVVHYLLTSANAQENHHILVMDRYYNSVPVPADNAKYFCHGNSHNQQKAIPQCVKVKKIKNQGDSDFHCKNGMAMM